MFLRAFLLSLLLCSPVKADNTAWNTIRGLLFAKKEIIEDNNIITVEAPDRAEEASMVPVKIKLADNVEARNLTLIVDENPMPVVGSFTFGGAAGPGWYIETRIRVNTYSNFRAIAEVDGKLYQAKHFIKAAGGCSSPALKDIDVAMSNLGKIKINTTGTSEAHLMISHPQYSGMQKDPVTGYDIPAKYVTEISVSGGDILVFSMKGGISLSENPNLRFKVKESYNKMPLNVIIRDSDIHTFYGSSL